MDDDSHPDRLLSEPSELPSHQHDQAGSMSLGPSPAVDDVSPINGDSVAPTTAAPPVEDPNAKIVHDVLNSDIGVSTLLNRLKQSIASAKEFALFLKKRSTLEEEHSNGLKKLCRTTSESIRGPEQRHGSFLHSYDEITVIHERMAENGAQFASSLHQMHGDLLELASNIERGRKHWKTTGLAAEQRVADAEAAMRKSKAKYDSLAEDYDRAKTGDRQSGKKFGLKGPKSAAQHEEDLLRKVQAADSDYATKVQAAQAQRSELLSKLRPEALKSIQDLVKECDSALTMQMQKFASFNEKLLLSNGLNVSPMKGVESGNKQRSLREAVQAIDNNKDFSNYVSSYGSKLPPHPAEIRYEKNPVLQPVQTQAAPPPQRQSDPAASYNSRQGPPPQSFGALQGPPNPSQANPAFHNQGPPIQQHERSYSQGQPQQLYQSGSMASIGSAGGPPKGPINHGAFNAGPYNSSGPPQLSTLPFQTANAPGPMFPQQQGPPAAPYAQPGSSSYSQSPVATNANYLPPLKPVFGKGLEELFERDGSAVPMVVYQCIQAVDLFGLEVEGVYRLSGTSSHVSKIKALFDNDASKVDFRNPENFFHDVNSVAGLLKQFFRELPDPLLTAEHYAGFIEAAKSDDDIVRRDSLHAIINSLPDPNYATLRALTLHLNRVTDRSSVNRMNASNLAIVFGPTLMGTNTGSDIQDAGWQVRVIDTILNNTYQIFDDD